MLHPLTRIQSFKGWTAKREDEAFFMAAEYPSGSKVRQYLTMAAAQPNTPMLVGCSAHSAMQIYVAASAKQAGVPGIIFTAARKQRTEATEYALSMGAELIEIRPAYLSVCRARAKARAKELGAVVRWNVALALQDAADQCANLPKAAKRIVIPTGSGLTAAGVLAGIAARSLKNPPAVVAVAVSDMAEKAAIIAQAKKLTEKKLPKFSLIRAPGKYEKWLAAKLPDGTPLDPYYAAKALSYIKPGDCLWVPGLRPLSAMPRACQKALAEL